MPDPNKSMTPEIELAQLRSVTAKMPTFALSLIICLAANLVLFHNLKPRLLTIGAPLAVIALTLFWAFLWRRFVSREFARERRRLILLTAMASFGISCFFILLVMTYQFTVGDNTEQMFIIFSIVAFGGSLYLCVIHERIMSVFILVMMFATATGFFATMGGKVGWLGACVTPALGYVLYRIAEGYRRDFAAQVIAKLKVENLARENSRLAHLDMLTQLPNRRHFFDALATLMRDGRVPLTVGIVDLDGFKAINDTYGHRVGDNVLIEVARRLSTADSRTIEFCRLGGDEFCFIVPQDTSEGTLIDIGTNLIATLASPIEVGDLLTSVGGSVGFAKHTDPDETAEDLFMNADFALYHAKRTGKAHSVIYSDEHKQYIAAHGVIEQAMRIADLEKELYPLFQPIIDSNSGKILAFEALARWSSPTLGAVSPAQFIPVAEQSGLISRITKIVLRKALENMKDWPFDVGLSFNLSPHDITSRVTVLSVLGLIGKSGISPGRISLEITESALINEYATATAHVEMIRSAGIHVALDDFGTGYSSLSHLHNLPFNKLKIDRAFVAELETKTSCQNIIRSVVALCKDLNLECIVEGVETAGQIAKLNELGCSKIQGFFYARPMPPGDIAAFLSAEHGNGAPLAANFGT